MESRSHTPVNHRLRMESSGGEHLRRVIRLEMQRHMQLRGEDLGSPQQVRRRREGAVERHFLAQKKKGTGTEAI